MVTRTTQRRPFSAPGGAGWRSVAAGLGLAVALPPAVAVALLGAAPQRAGDARRSAGLPHAPPGVVASLGRRPSHHQLYDAEVVAATPLAVGASQRWTVRLTRRGNGDVADARLAVRAWVPETGEVSPRTPRARYVGGGRYQLDGIYFSGPAWWNVALVVAAGAGTDSVAFNVIMPAAQPCVDGRPGTRPAPTLTR